MLAVFHASQALFHTGWFVGSLATQTLVLLVIRTVSNPFHCRPSLALTITTCLAVAVGILLPFTPLAASQDFAPLPGLYFPVSGRGGQATNHAQGLSKEERYGRIES